MGGCDSVGDAAHSSADASGAVTQPTATTDSAVRLEPCSLCIITRFGGAAIAAFKGVVLGSPPSTCMDVCFFLLRTK